MKPFNLEEYLKNPDREVVTRDGRPVRIICTDRKGATPIIALVNDGLSEELGHAFYSDGKIFSDEDNELDLFFAPEKHEGWINIYRGKDYPCVGLVIYNSEEEAEEASRHCTGFTKDLHLATVKIEWEE